MKDVGEAAFVLGIEIHQDRRNVYQDITEGILEKDFKEVQYACV